MIEQKIATQPVSFARIDAEHADRRLDNFLISHLNKLPKTRIYKMIRKGEVRVNKHRIKQHYRLQIDDIVRIPPLYLEPEIDPLRFINYPSSRANSLSALLRESVIYEDEHLIAINKPANVAVHGGSGVFFGVINILRAQRPELSFIELVHRLDKVASGCLLMAKNRATLLHMHNILRSGDIQKEYLGLLKGYFADKSRLVDIPLLSSSATATDIRVKVNKAGKQSVTNFQLLEHFNNTSLVRIRPMTGRKHQIRVHASSIGHPLVGDEKYGDPELNQVMKKNGLKRLFLHAQALSFALPGTAKKISITAPLADDLEQCLKKLRSAES